MRCLRYGNEGRMHVILNGEPFDEVDCLKYLGMQVDVKWMCYTERIRDIERGER